MTTAIQARKIAELMNRVARARELLAPDVATFLAERTTTEALILNLFLALQASADLAMLAVGQHGLGVPGAPRDALTLLRDAGLLEVALAERLSAAVGLRNRIAHQYGTLDLRRVYVAARDGLDDLDAFARAVSLALESRAP